MGEVWESGDAYEPYVGRWSRLVATKFLDWPDLAPQKSWLDVESGTGALSAAILTQCEPTSVLGVDPSPAYVAWAGAQIQDSRANFVTGDATNLPQEIFEVAPKGIVAAVALDPGAAKLDEGRRFDICNPERLESIWRDAGFTDVRSQLIDVPTVFRDFDDYWTPFLGGQAPAPG